jgi:inorganic triphosphatase YgiF
MKQLDKSGCRPADVPAARELELKFELTEAQSSRLVMGRLPASLPARKPKTSSLTSVYFDTASHALRRAATSLRVRRIGRKWVQTMKAGTGVAGGVSNPVEAETPVAACAPDLAALPDFAADHLRRLTGAEPLMPVFETQVNRTARIVMPDGRGAVEVAVDIGQIASPAGVLPLREAELELAMGDAQSLCDAAERLFSGEAFRFGRESKAERGYRLAMGAAAPDLAPRKAAPVAIASGESCAGAFRQACQSAAGQVLHNWEVTLGSDDPEGPHQLRVGLRRLRSALRAFRSVIDTDALRRLNEEARDIGRHVGAVRDLDVLALDIVGPVLEEGDAALHALCDLVAAETVAARSSLQATLASPDWSSFRIRLALLPHGAGWQDGEGRKALAGLDAAGFGAQALEKSWRRAAKLAKRLDALDIQARHELRKRFKALRYTAEFLESLYPPERSKLFLKPLKRLLNLFGYLNDVAMAEKLTALCRERADGDAALLDGAARVMAWHAARADAAWSKVPANWSRLKKAPRFWRAE